MDRKSPLILRNGFKPIRPQGLSKFDTDAATTSDLVIYIGPSGTDAWAEVGAAWARKVPVYGLWAKGEPVGLMRRMMKRWFRDHRALLEAVPEAKGELAEAS